MIGLLPQGARAAQDGRDAYNPWWSLRSHGTAHSPPHSSQAAEHAPARNAKHRLIHPVTPEGHAGGMPRRHRRSQPWNKQRVSRDHSIQANFAGGNKPSRIIVNYALCIMHYKSPPITPKSPIIPNNIRSISHIPRPLRGRRHLSSPGHRRRQGLSFLVSDLFVYL